MKTLAVFLFLIVFFAISCEKKGSSIPLNDTFDSTTAILRYQGTFKNGPYGTVMGTARVYQSNGKWQVRLGNLSATNGPDLKVYLSKEIQPLNFIKLGDLKSTSGNQSYNITTIPDFLQFRYVLIHCEQYNHLFGSAELSVP